MSNIVKTKFSGFLRGLLRRMDNGAAPKPEAQRPLAHDTLAAPQPQPIESQDFNGQPIATSSVESTNLDELEIPLQPVLAGLPMDLRAKIVQMPPQGAMLVVPVEKVLSQLANGSVKITFGELRAGASGVFVNSGGEYDSRPVMLPLNDILVRLHPSLLRRNAQKRIEVSEEIAGPFTSGGKGVSFTISPLKSAEPAPVKRPAPQPSLPSRSVAPPPSAAPIPFNPRPVTPLPAANGDTGFLNAFAPVKNGNGNGNGHASVVPPLAVSPAPQPQQIIQTPLTSLMESWPESLKLEVTQSNLLRARVAFPLNLIEPGMKRGRITLTWKHLRSLIQPQPPASVHDGVELELPLKVIAPLFFAAQKAGARPQQKLSVSEEIPNLFFGFPQPQTQPPAPATPLAPAQPPKPATDVFLRKSAVPSPQPPLAAPAPPRSVAPIVPPAPAAPVHLSPDLMDTDIFLQKGKTPPAPKPMPQTIEEISPVEFKPHAVPGTDFSSRFATPAQIVERAMEIPGVAGAVVALPDGLKVASEVRSAANADTIAAFLPQIINRVNQCTRELRMGDLNHLLFTVGMVQWEIFRVGGVFLAVFSDLNEPLPSAQLAQLAAQLERRK